MKKGVHWVKLDGVYTLEKLKKSLNRVKKHNRPASDVEVGPVVRGQGWVELKGEFNKVEIKKLISKISEFYEEQKT